MGIDESCWASTWHPPRSFELKCHVLVEDHSALAQTELLEILEYSPDTSPPCPGEWLSLIKPNRIGGGQSLAQASISLFSNNDAERETSHPLSSRTWHSLDYQPVSLLLDEPRYLPWYEVSAPSNLSALPFPWPSRKIIHNGTRLMQIKNK